MARSYSQRKRRSRQPDPIATYIKQVAGDSWRVFSLHPALPRISPAGYGPQTKAAAEAIAKGLAEETGGEYKGELYLNPN